MRKVDHYVCELCGIVYDDKERCSECEEGHKKPIEIAGADWISIERDGSGYPVQVYIKMSNGETITYKR